MNTKILNVIMMMIICAAGNRLSAASNDAKQCAQLSKEGLIALGKQKWERVPEQDQQKVNATIEIGLDEWRTILHRIGDAKLEQHMQILRDQLENRKHMIARYQQHNKNTETMDVILRKMSGFNKIVAEVSEQLASAQSKADAARQLAERVVEKALQDPKNQETLDKALLYAAKNGYVDLVTKMIQAGADVIDAKDKDNHTALMLAEKNGHQAVIDCLKAAENQDYEQAMSPIMRAMVEYMTLCGDPDVEEHEKLLMARCVEHKEAVLQAYHNKSPMSIADILGWTDVCPKAQSNISFTQLMFLHLTHATEIFGEGHIDAMTQSMQDSLPTQVALSNAAALGDLKECERLVAKGTEPKFLKEALNKAQEAGNEVVSTYLKKQLDVRRKQSAKTKLAADLEKERKERQAEQEAQALAQRKKQAERHERNRLRNLEHRKQKLAKSNNTPQIAPSPAKQTSPTSSAPLSQQSASQTQKNKPAAQALMEQLRSPLNRQRLESELQQRQEAADRLDQEVLWNQEIDHTIEEVVAQGGLGEYVREGLRKFYSSHAGRKRAGDKVAHQRVEKDDLKGVQFCIAQGTDRDARLIETGTLLDHAKQRNAGRVAAYLESIGAKHSHEYLTQLNQASS